MSAIKLSVGQYTMEMMFLIRRSRIQKNPMRIWRDSSDVGPPFYTSLIVDWLSCSTVIGELGKLSLILDEGHRLNWRPILLL